MDNPKELYSIISSPEHETVGDLVHDHDSVAYCYVSDPAGFLNVVGKDNLTNRQRIEKSYIFPGEELNIGSKKTDRLPLKRGTILYLEYSKVQDLSFLTEGIEVVSTDEPAFKAAALAAIEADPGYYQINKPVRGKLLTGTAQEFYPEVTVWIWCRALSPKSDEDTELTGQFFDLTPFILNCTTNMSKNGGNFSLTLPPLMCVLNEDRQWVIRRKSINRYENKKGTSLQGEGYVAESSLFHSEPKGREGDDVLVRNQFLFHNIISANDLIFIRYETLHTETKKRNFDQVSKLNIAGNIYDMIGLVDSNSQSVNPETNDVTISIQGRDLSKLFLEDGTYFYALENSQGLLKFAGQSESKNSLINRNFQDNAIQSLNLFMGTGIGYILKFILQQLSNIEIVPGNLFESYGSRRNTRFNDVETVDQKEKNDYTVRAKAEIFRLKEAQAMPTGSEIIDRMFTSMEHFLTAIRTNKVRSEIKNITAGWGSFTYNNGETVGKNRFPESIVKEFYKNEVIDMNLQPLVALVDQYIDSQEKKSKHKQKEVLANGIWQIVKLVIDDSVSKRRIQDSSFSSAQGAIMNFMRTACQEPLVEFYMDTYGDMYHLIVRKPPYDQKALISLLEGHVNTEEGKPDIPPAVVDVLPEDVLNEQLSFDDSQVYSWYHFFPKYNFTGESNDISLSYLGALYFEEYAKIYGSKPFNQSHPYLPYEPYNNVDKGIGLCENQAIEDLKYVVETCQYLPFTRKGKITLNGDRRIKIGNIIRYKSTGEIFFVESVQQNYQITENSIERTTTVGVVRGMIEQLIYGVTLQAEDGSPRFVSYYNIINTDLDKSHFKEVVNKEIKTREISNDPNRWVKPATNSNGTAATNDNPFKPSFNTNPVTTAINKRNKPGFNNPGNVRGRDGKFVIYDSYEEGRQALIRQLKLYQTGRTRNAVTPDSTLYQAMAIYAPSSDNNNPKHYAEFIAGKLGIKPDTAIKNIDVNRWADSIEKMEGNTNLQKSRGNAFKNNTTGVQAIEETYTVTTTSKELDRDKVFGNFKVNKFNFNFFLKRLQFDPAYRIVTNRNVISNAGTELEGVKVQSIRKK